MCLLSEDTFKVHFIIVFTNLIKRWDVFFLPSFLLTFACLLACFLSVCREHMCIYVHRKSLQACILISSSFIYVHVCSPAYSLRFLEMWVGKVFIKFRKLWSLFLQIYFWLPPLSETSITQLINHLILSRKWLRFDWLIYLFLDFSFCVSSV